ncbi:hypothetical protein IJM86_08605 [bacterium]|nr:hypothetical protein [bacterium]
MLLLGMEIGVTSASSLVYDLLGTHIEIGLHETNTNRTDTSLKGQISSFSGNKLIQKLDRAKTKAERKKILSEYLSLCRTISNTSSQLIAQEEKEAQFYQNEVRNCEQNRAYENESFSKALADWNFEKAHQHSLNIAEMRACTAKNTVFWKEHLAYQNFYQSQTKHLEKKCRYIETNQEKIAQYYEIMKPDLLKELYDIAMTLQVNFKA